MIGASNRDKTLKTVTAKHPISASSLSSPASASADLSRVRHPVLFRFNGNDPNEGKPYSAGMPPGIIFDHRRRPSNQDLYAERAPGGPPETSVGTGLIQWTQNADGDASGGYFAVISSPTSKSVVKRPSSSDEDP